MLIEDIKYFESEGLPLFPGCFAEEPCTLLDNPMDSELPHKLLLVDCRWPYEYEAGHVKSAVNYYDG